MKVGVDRGVRAGELRREALGRLEVIADTFLSMNAPVQLAMPAWLAGRAGIQGQILERARGNLAVLGAVRSAGSCSCWVLKRDGAR